MDILKKEIAPISEKAWEEIAETAEIALKRNLSARKVVDVEGPKGLEFAGVNMGRVAIPKNQADNEVQFGIRKILPIIETRIPFDLDIWELDNIDRGAEDADMDPLEKAAAKIAAYEEEAIYYGHEYGMIRGIEESIEHKPIRFSDPRKDFLDALNGAANTLHASGVEGPYSLAINGDLWGEISSISSPYPIRKQIKEIISGEVVKSESVKEAFLVSRRGGDFVLTLGVDLSIGFDKADARKASLYLTESFTFRVVDPAAAISIIKKQ